MKITTTALTLLAGLMVSSASAIVTAPGFTTPDPSASFGTQLSGLNSISEQFGTLDGSNNAFVSWEYFSAGAFSGLGPQYWSNNGALTASLYRVNSAGGTGGPTVNVGGEDYFGRLATGGYSFELDATTSIDAGLVTLAIKHTPFFDENFEAIVAFSATLNGIAADRFIKGDYLSNFSDPLTTMNMTNNYYIYQWDVSLLANDSFTLAFESGADLTGFGFSLDSISLSVQPIPEPSTVILLGAGAVGAVLLRRRRRSA